MERYGFIIKIADLLHNPGTQDTIQLQNKFSTRFPHPLKDGISVMITATGLNDSDIQIVASGCTANFEAFCDRCGNNYIYEIRLEDQEIIASTASDTNEGVHIDKKNERIDLEDWVVDLLLIDLPVKLLCTSCGKQKIEDETIDTNTSSITRKYEQ